MDTATMTPDELAEAADDVTEIKVIDIMVMKKLNKKERVLTGVTGKLVKDDETEFSVTHLFVDDQGVELFDGGPQEDEVYATTFFGYDGKRKFAFNMKFIGHATSYHKYVFSKHYPQ